MIRAVLAALLFGSLALSGSSARADLKIISVKAAAGKTTVKLAGKHHGRHRYDVVALRTPRCTLVRRSTHGQHWRGLTCPRIAWAGSAPRQPWSYAMFRRNARWDQRIALWQSHIAPGLTHPTIYWGY